LFINKKPSELIEGYFDPIINETNSFELYEGGDISINSFINHTLIIIDNNITTFNGGFDNESEYVNIYYKWHDLTYITYPIKTPRDINDKEGELIYINPWKEKINIAGTDGFLFNPKVKEN